MKKTLERVRNPKHVVPTGSADNARFAAVRGGLEPTGLEFGEIKTTLQ